MGRVVTPTYRVEVRMNVGSMTPFCWDCRRDGRPTVKNLEAWRQKYNQSFQPGGVNGPRKADDVILHISRAKVIRQSTGEVVAETVAPMFEVV